MIDAVQPGKNSGANGADGRTGLRANHHPFAVRLSRRQHMPRLRVAGACRFNIENVKGVKVQFAVQVTGGKGAVIGNKRQVVAGPQRGPLGNAFYRQRLFHI